MRGKFGSVSQTVFQFRPEIKGILQTLCYIHEVSMVEMAELAIERLAEQDPAYQELKRERDGQNPAS